MEESADSYLVVGDLSGLLHLYMIKRNLPKDKQVEGTLYSQHSNINEHVERMVVYELGKGVYKYWHVAYH